MRSILAAALLLISSFPQLQAEWLRGLPIGGQVTWCDKRSPCLCTYTKVSATEVAGACGLCSTGICGAPEKKL